MQEMYMNRNSGPLFPQQSTQKVPWRTPTSGQKQPKRNRFLIHFLSISFVALSVRLYRISRHILTFLITALNGKKVAHEQKILQAGVVVVEEDKYLAPPEFQSEVNNDLKDHFLALASHELKTPMTTIVGQTQLLLRRFSNLPVVPAELVSMRTALESIDGQTRRLNVLVDNLLDLYTIRSGKVDLQLASCNLVTICEKAVEEQRLLTGRTIALESSTDDVQMVADAERIRQVVVNLVNNALRYSAEDTAVTVRVYQNRDIGIIEVQDSGVGMSKEHHAHIFEPFYRGPAEQVSAKSGLGLGLAICKDIVERHHGRIWCRSRSGKGSTFIVELPVNKRVMQ